MHGFIDVAIICGWVVAVYAIARTIGGKGSWVLETGRAPPSRAPSRRG